MTFVQLNHLQAPELLSFLFSEGKLLTLMLIHVRKSHLNITDSMIRGLGISQLTYAEKTLQGRSFLSVNFPRYLMGQQNQKQFPKMILKLP